MLCKDPFAFVLMFIYLCVTFLGLLFIINNHLGNKSLELSSDHFFYCSKDIHIPTYLHTYVHTNLHIETHLLQILITNCGL